MHKLRVRSLHHREHIKKLRRVQRSGHTCVARWATILLLSHQGRSVQEIATGMGLHVQTVRARIRTFNAADRHQRWDLLRPPRRPGRRVTYGREVQQGLVDLLRQSSAQFGVDSGVWRLQDLVTVAKHTGLVRGPAAQTFNVETVRRWLRKAGYVYLSAKWWITSDDPHYQHWQPTASCKKARRDKLVVWAKRNPSIMVLTTRRSSSLPTSTKGLGSCTPPTKP